tara:strand:+ start:1802 stop:1996 length:195 start_codon:yes stop_codon:yes gene_type:complete
MIGGARTRSRRGGRRTRRGGASALRKAALPALLTGLVLSQSKRRGRKSRGGRKSRRGGRRTRRA